MGTQYQVLEQYDLGKDYGINIQRRFEKFLLLLKKGDTINPTEFAHKNHGNLGTKKGTGPKNSLWIVRKGITHGLLIGIIKVVNVLFSKYKNVKALANAKLKDVEKIIKSIGFYHIKAKRIIEVSKIINSKYKGKVPDNLEKLVELPGVGRKTANCVLVYGFDKPAIPVDIHVHRISNRLGLVETKTPEETELELMKKIPEKFWLEINDTFVMYGQNICKPISPMCNVCKIKKICKFYKSKTAS